MGTIKKNRYGKDYVQISLNIPVRLLAEYQCMADFLELKRSQVIIAALSSFENCFSYNAYDYTRNAIKRMYRKEQKK